MIIDEYKNELNDFKNKICNITSVNVKTILVYGSAYNDNTFTRGFSDIDILVMVEDFAKTNKREIINYLNALNIDFKEKRPILIKDSLCERIEFYVGYSNINLDITICGGLIPTLDSLEKDAWYDGFEALMGGVYIHSKCIYGSIVDYDEFKKNYFPFYGDELRKKRLVLISNRLKNYVIRIEQLLKNGSYDYIENIIKIRKFFVKFLFIYYRKYFWTPEKHIYFQLKEYLNLSESEIDTICLLKGNITDASESLIHLIKQYLKLFDEELQQ